MRELRSAGKVHDTPFGTDFAKKRKREAVTAGNGMQVPSPSVAKAAMSESSHSDDSEYVTANNTMTIEDGDPGHMSEDEIAVLGGVKAAISYGKEGEDDDDAGNDAPPQEITMATARKNKSRKNETIQKSIQEQTQRLKDQRTQHHTILKEQRRQRKQKTKLPQFLPEDILPVEPFQMQPRTSSHLRMPESIEEEDTNLRLLTKHSAEPRKGISSLRKGPVTVKILKKQTATLPPKANPSLVSTKYRLLYERKSTKRRMRSQPINHVR